MGQAHTPWMQGSTWQLFPNCPQAMHHAYSPTIIFFCSFVGNLLCLANDSQVGSHLHTLFEAQQPLFTPVAQRTHNNDQPGWQQHCFCATFNWDAITMQICMLPHLNHTLRYSPNGTPLPLTLVSSCTTGVHQSTSPQLSNIIQTKCHCCRFQDWQWPASGCHIVVLQL